MCKVPKVFTFTITNLTIKTGEEERTKKKNTLKEMTPKKKKNQGINPLKARIYKIKVLNYKFPVYLLQKIMIIVYAPCVTGL